MRKILYWWPEDGWQRGRLCQGGAFSHVVAYTRQTSALRGRADTLLDAASYCVRWVLLSPASGTGVARPTDSAAPARRSGRAPRPLLSAWSELVARHSLGLRPGPGPGRRPLPKLSSRRMFCGSFCGLSEAAEDNRCNGCSI